MNTLAKVLKKDMVNDVVVPFFIPELSANKTISEGIAEFSFTDAVDFVQPVETIHHEPIFAETDAEDILQSAREEAAQIIAQAESQKELIEQSVRDKALGEIRAEIQAEMAHELELLRQELALTIEQISSLHSQITDRAETDLVELALEIAKKVIGREITIDREVALTLAKIALSKLHNRTSAKVRLNPTDFAYLQSHRERFNFHGSLELIEDASISQGGCLIQTENGDIDARIESQLDEISYGLLGQG